MARKKVSRNKTAGRTPKSAPRKGKKDTTKPSAAPPGGTEAISFLYDQVVKKGGLEAIEDQFHASVFNAFAILKRSLARLDELEKKQKDKPKNE